VDRVLVVTEPTLSGIHDLERILGVAAHFRIGGMVCINRYDLNRRNRDRIRRFCDEKSVPVVGEIPFDPLVVDALVNARTVVEMGDGPVAEEIRRMWDRVHRVLSVP
jgi:MinD superfamily P-loop ATPase